MSFSLTDRILNLKVGEMTDEHGSNTLFGNMDRLNEHIHSAMRTYPELADHVLLTKAAGAWAAYPTPTEIIPANGIAEDFDIHWISVSTISANGSYMLRLYKGAVEAEVLIASIPLVRTAVTSQEGSALCTTPIIPANTRISAAISSGNAAQNTLSIKLGYHTY